MSIDSGIMDVIEGGAAAFSFENIGDTCKGKIVRAETKQQTDMNTGQPKTFSDGSPMMQVVVTVELEDGDESALYFKGGKYEVAEGKGQSALDALRAALDGQQLEIGGTLALQFSGLGKKKNAGWSSPKLYTCQYQPPTKAIADETDLI